MSHAVNYLKVIHSSLYKLLGPRTTTAPLRRLVHPLARGRARLYSQTAPVQSTAIKDISASGGYLTVRWSDTTTDDVYPDVFLRDSCQCPQCFNPDSRARAHLMHDFDPEILTREVKVLVKPTAMLRFIMDTERFGLVILTDTPKDDKQLFKMADAVAYPARTIYGTSFTVKTKALPQNLAYASGPLGLHTDQPTMQYAPQIQFLQCIQQHSGEGGGNTFADGFKTAEIIKESEPDTYDILTSTYVDFYDVGVEEFPFHVAHRHPTIGLDLNGGLQSVHFTQQMRAYILNLPLEQIRPLYRALKCFYETMHENRVQYKLQPGDTAVCDNSRVTHGRTDFRAIPGEQRHLEGMYINWDEMMSKRRVLQEQLGLTETL